MVAQSVAIGVATFRRPGGLDNLLRGISELSWHEPLRVILVDNDPRRSAGEIARRWASHPRLSLDHYVEENPGIASARNRVLEETGDADFIAFIDDDEYPCPDWLQELMETQSRFDADMVAGPVIPRFEETPPSWVVDGRFFERPRHWTGTPLAKGATGNFLIRTGLLRDLGGFDDGGKPESGATDTHLTMKATSQGYSLVWSDEACVFEWLPPERVNLSWLMRRTLRSGSSYTEVVMRLDGSPKVAAGRFLKGFARIIQGFVHALWGIVTLRRHSAVGGLRVAVTGLGGVLGLAGWTYPEYRRDEEDATSE